MSAQKAQPNSRKNAARQRMGVESSISLSYVCVGTDTGERWVHAVWEAPAHALVKIRDWPWVSFPDASLLLLCDNVSH